MPRCEIRWIDKDGNPTPDNSVAVMIGRTKPYLFERLDGTVISVEASRWFFVCERHSDRLMTLSNWESKSVIVDHANYMAE